ncbi:MAG: type 4a pilus biogenesis protein PilO [Deltaproteobacteria bacterium]|nr:type 4a pilus biogenesis protein PilO [Deltaproteobacteria bacterium]
MDNIKEQIMAKVEPFVNKVGALAPIQRHAIFIGSVIVIIGIYIYFIYLPKSAEVGELNEKYKTLVKEVSLVKKKAKTLDEFKKKMEEASVQFQIAKKTLPEKKDIPSLLANISRAGRDAGLEFLLFQPQQQIQKEFYAEIPVSINISGHFHQLALFFDKVANLSRIVNITDINIKSQSNEALKTSCKAVTYKFIDEASSTDKKDSKNKKKSKKKKTH